MTSALRATAATNSRLSRMMRLDFMEMGLWLVCIKDIAFLSEGADYYSMGTRALGL